MTNKTKLSAAALFSALVLGGSFVGSTVFAADTQTKSGVTQSNKGTVTETGHAYVTFTRSTGPQVLNPSDPGTSYTPSNSDDITNETGSLTLDAIPSSLNFGTNESTGQAQTVQLLQSEGKDFSGGKDGSTPDQQTLADGTKADRVDSPNGPKTSDTGMVANTDADAQDAASTVKANGHTVFTQVTNMTSGPVNWTLSATLSNFFKSGPDAKPGDTNAIPGASIFMKKGKNVTNHKTPGTWTDADTAIDAGLELKATQAATVVGSNAEKGTFQQQWNVGDVTLVAPEGAPIGQFEANIDWTLSAEPLSDLDA